MILPIICVAIWGCCGYFARKLTLTIVRSDYSAEFNARWEYRDNLVAWMAALGGPLGLIAVGIVWLATK